MIGDAADCCLGWVRDAACEPPAWPLAVVSGQTVAFAVPGTDVECRVEFYNPQTGLAAGVVQAAAVNGILTVTLPDFTDAIAFKVFPAAGSGELIVNGGFDDGLDAWEVSRQNGVDCAAGVSGGVMSAGSFTGLRDPYADSGVDSDVSLWQHGLALQLGKAYTLSFEAWSAGPRTISAIIIENNRDNDGDGNTYSWYCRSGLYEISTVPRTYTFTFYMQHPDDNDARLSFGLAGGSPAVSVDNVSLRLSGLVPPAIGSNQMRNGDFTDGLSSWTYWMDASQGGRACPHVVSNELFYDVQDGGSGPLVELSQAGLILEAGKSYTLRFTARSNASKQIYVVIDENGFDHGNDGNAYTGWLSWRSQMIGATNTSYQYDFTMPGTTDYNAKLKFYVGGSDNPIWLDDVSLVKND